ncbi:MAG: type VI secretion system tip protein TssI/VgrG, partial [Minicystis sp.]
LPQSAKVVGFRGTEAMSRPYEIEIFLSLRQELGEEFDLGEAIGAKARLALDGVGDKIPAFQFAGLFANLEILHAHDGHILLRALLVPRLWQLGLSRHSRVFAKMTVPDIIKAILEENGVTEYECRLGSYEVEEHVCQYRESDLDFISRWMEREGIYYFFEHEEDGEKLILGDHRTYEDDPIGKPVRYHPQIGHDHSAGASFRAFTCRHTTLPAKVRLKDYDYAKPSLDVAGSAKVASNGSGEVSLYGERFFTPAAGDKLARIRAEELLARQVVYHGAGARLHLRPGYTFELEEHPLPSFNKGYLTIQAHHSGNQAVGHSHFRELIGIEHQDVYQVEIEAIPRKTQFRAESRAAWPRIYGYENGIVDGAAETDYAQLDDQGRYNAKFKFDESALKGGKATTWVRMMQPHGGDIEGFHFPLRKGTEVMFSFLGGDPDRPVISGVVPNALNPSPVTKGNYTKNVIQTGAHNRLELEDKAGSEWIRLSTPFAGTFVNMGLAWPLHELNLGTQANAALTAQGALDIAVGNAEPGPSGAGNMTVHVLNNLTTTVDNQDMTTTVSTGNMTTTVQSGNEVHEVNAGTFTEKVQSDVLLTYNATKTEHVDSGQVTETFLAQDTKVATILSVTAGGPMLFHAKALHSVTSDACYFHVIKGITSFQTVGFTDIGTTGPTHIHGTADILIDTPADVTIKGNKVELVAATKKHFTMGANYEMTVGANAKLNIAADATLNFSASLTATVGVKLELCSAIDLKEKLAKQEACMTYMLESPFMEMLSAQHNITTGLFTLEAGLISLI